MMLSAFSALTASLLYLFASLFIWRKVQTKASLDVRKPTLTFAAVAALLHIYALGNTLFDGMQIEFGLGNAISLIALLGTLALLINNLNQKTETLGIFIFPLAALSTLLPYGLQQTSPLSHELGSHVLISLSAYSILSLATAQAILYSIQEKRFRKKQLSTLLQALPPLQVMEKTLVRLIVIGFVLLTFALISGAFFVEDMFAQHLIHKTFFAILAWLVYATFLSGHFKRGWRGQKAARYCIWAYGLLIISYIGTEIVIRSISY